MVRLYCRRCNVLKPVTAAGVFRKHTKPKRLGNGNYTRVPCQGSGLHPDAVLTFLEQRRKDEDLCIFDPPHPIECPDCGTELTAEINIMNTLVLLDCNKCGTCYEAPLSKPKVAKVGNS